MASTSFRYRLAGLLGNFLEHYDMALFGLLAPFIAPLFFNPQDHLTALILTYGMMPLGLLTRPLGALFFGWIGDNFGRTKALSASLLGMALITVFIGCLPTYAELGWKAPLLLAIGRMLQNFFAAGETTGGAIFVLEHTPKVKKGFISGLYGFSSMAGILVASGLISLLSYFELVQIGWRWLFWLGSLCGVLGVLLRMRTKESQDFVVNREKQPHHSLWRILQENRRLFLYFVCAAGFTYTTYALPFTLMNGYIPLVTNLTLDDALKYNTALIVADLLLLPFFGWLADKYGVTKVMYGGAIGAALGGIPLFYLLNEANLIHILVIRTYIVICGVAFAAPYYAWSMQLAPVYCRYRLLAFSNTIGSQLIGASSSTICLWLYQQTHWIAIPGVYLSAVALLAMYAVLAPWRSRAPAFTQS